MVEKNYIFLDQELATKEAIIQFICEIAQNNSITDDKKKLLEDIQAREQEFSTDLGMGIAIPHAKSDVVKKPAICFVRVKEPVAWGEDSKIKGAIAFLTPKNNPNNLHLQMLSKVSRQLVHQEFIDLLLNRGSIEDIYNKLYDSLNQA